MPVLSLGHPKPRRRPPEKVLDVATGASAVGSTYWARLVTCPREHALHQLGLRKEGDKEALTVGWLFHLGLERYYRMLWEAQCAHDDPKRLMAAARAAERVELEHAAQKAAFGTLSPLLREDGYGETYEEVTRLLDSYWDFYRGRDRWRIIAVEEELMVQEPPYSARLDLVVHDLDHDCMRVIEHKTARTFGADQIEGYALNWQVQGQIWLMHEVVDLSKYPRFAGVTVNLTTRHAQPRHLRTEVPVNDDQLAAFTTMLKQWREVTQIYADYGWPRDLTKCAGYSRGYGRCSYFDLCYSYPRVTVAEWRDRPPPFGFQKGESP